VQLHEDRPVGQWERDGTEPLLQVAQSPYKTQQSIDQSIITVMTGRPGDMTTKKYVQKS